MAIIKAIGGRFFGKAPAILLMDWMIPGRVVDGTPVGLVHTIYKIRTGFIRAHPVTANVPNSHVIQFPAGLFPKFPEGLVLVTPHNKSSPGYKFLNYLPLMRMKILEQELDEIKIRLATIIESADYASPEHIKEQLMGMIEILEKIRIRGSMTGPETTLTTSLIPPGSELGVKA